MPLPARRLEDEMSSLIDPSAVPRRLARQRAKREARIEHDAELKRARVRFWGLLGALLFLAIVLSLTIWDQIQALFGL